MNAERNLRSSSAAFSTSRRTSGRSYAVVVERRNFTVNPISSSVATATMPHSDTDGILPSNMQSASQPSPFAVLPSSHSSVAKPPGALLRRPSPQNSSTKTGPMTLNTELSRSIIAGPPSGALRLRLCCRGRFAGMMENPWTDGGGQLGRWSVNEANYAGPSIAVSIQM